MACVGEGRVLQAGGWAAAVVAVGLSVLTGLWLASAAQAGWLPPVNVSEAGSPGAAQVVLDAAGDATAVWDYGNGSDSVVAVAYRPAGEGWQTPVEVSEEEEPLLAGEHDAYSPRVTVDGAGDTTIVWARYAGTNKILIQAVYRPAGGAWQAPVDLGEMHSMTDPEPWVASDEAGDTTAVWKSGEVVESSYRPAGGSWEAPIALSAGESFVPQAAMDANGDALVAWLHYDGSHYVVEGAYRSAGQYWQPREVLSAEGEEGGDPEIAIAGAGEAIVVWDGNGGEARAVYRLPGEGWQAPVTISGAGVQQQTMRVALDPQGNAMLVWSEDDPKVNTYAIVQASYRPTGGEWQQPTTLSEDGENGYPCDVVFDKQGNAAVVWQRSNGTNEIIQADYKPAGEGWQPPADLSREGSDATDAVVVLDSPGNSTTADGDATAVWASSEGGGRVQAAGYDAIEPAEPLEAPSEGEVGQPVEVTAPTADVWSPTLSFGDGTQQAGTSATHIYDAPGEYTVTFSSREVLGYARSARRKILIRPSSGESPPSSEPPPPPPPGKEESHLPEGETGDPSGAGGETSPGPAPAGSGTANAGGAASPVAGTPASGLSTAGSAPPSDLIAFKASIATLRQSLRMIRRTRELRFLCRLSERGSCQVETRLGNGRLRFRQAGEGVLIVHLKPKALVALRHARMLRLAFIATIMGRKRVTAHGVLSAR